MRQSTQNDRYSYSRTPAGILRATFPWIRQVLIRAPWLPLLLLAAAFYIYRASYLPWFWLLPLTGVVIAINALLLWLGTRIVRRRLARPALQLRAELAVATGIAPFFFVFDFAQLAWPMSMLPLLVLAWLLLEALVLRRPGVFYAGFVGLVLFFLAVSSYRTIRGGSYLIGLALQYQARREAREQLPENAWETRVIHGEPYRVLRRGNEDLIRLPLPTDMHFFDARVVSMSADLIPPGFPICYVSSSPTDPFASPAFFLFRIPGRIAAAEVGRKSVEQSLRQRMDAGELTSLAPEGAIQLESPPAAVPLSGFGWRFRDLVFEEDARMRLLLTQQISGGTFAIVLYEPEVSGFRMHPRLARILAGLEFPTADQTNRRTEPNR